MSSSSGNGDWRRSRWGILVGFAGVVAVILIPRLTHSTAVRLVANLVILALGVYMAIDFIRRLNPPRDDRANTAEGDDDRP